MKRKWSRSGLVVLVIALLAAAPLAVREIAGQRASSVARPGDPDAKGNKAATASVEKGPAAATAAEEAYAQRAYPATEIPIQLTLNAQEAWTAAKARGVGRDKNTPGQWTLIGPSHAQVPSLLTFTGSQYVTSGRITALVVDPDCTQSRCRVWVAAAGGGVWRTSNGLSGSPSWDFVSGSFSTNAVGALTYDAASKTLYAGTGELNASADSEAGLGIFKSTDGGDTWTHLPAVTSTTISGTYTGDAFLNRAISEITVDPTNPSTIYVASGSAIRGVCSVLNGCDAAPQVPLPGRGVYKSTDGGQTFTLLNSAAPTGLPFVLRGATNVKLDPSDPNTIYAGLFGQGVWRSSDGGAAWTRIFAPVSAVVGGNIERDSIAVTKLTNDKTRIYLGAGDNGTFSSRLYRTDDAAGAASFANITTSQVGRYCGGQCWYDNVVYSPPGRPDTVYVGGSYDYSNSGTPALGGNAGKRTNGRTFLYSTDAGSSFTDLTRDASSADTPNGMHPDQHAIAVAPSNPNIVFFGSDGGVVRSSGSFSDISAQCDTRGLSGDDLTLCRQLLSRVPTELVGLNRGLSTLQFQSLSANPGDPKNLMGGTQDNGTFEFGGSSVVWPQLIWGDGGQSGFNAGNPALRFNTFTGQANDVNFRNGEPAYWVVASGDILSSPEGSYFYAPVTADPNPANAGTIYQGSYSVWRTTDWGGDQAFLEANCSEFGPGGVDHSADPNCGDFEPIGPSGHTNLRANDSLYGGADRAGTFVAAIERAPSDTGTLWVATGAGRVFVSKNADAAAGSVTFTRIDNLPSATADPARFVSSIFVDPANPNHAWISYSGYNVLTPDQRGHVFSVTYTPGTAPDATWTSLDGSGDTAFPDLPATDLVRDSNGDLYASSDFGVMRLPSGSSDWVVAGAGLPNVEVAGLTIVPGARKLYAATHGRSAWALTLP